MVDCSQRVALVLGGAGNVGSGVVGGFLRRGYRKVVVVSRDPVRMNTLRQRCADERLVCILGDIGSEASAEAARQEVSDRGVFKSAYCATKLIQRPLRSG